MTNISVASLYEKKLDRQTKLLENLNKQKFNELLKELLLHIFNLQLKVWKTLAFV